VPPLSELCSETVNRGMRYIKDSVWNTLKSRLQVSKRVLSDCPLRKCKKSWTSFVFARDAGVSTVSDPPRDLSEGESPKPPFSGFASACGLDRTSAHMIAWRIAPVCLKGPAEAPPSPFRSRLDGPPSLDPGKEIFRPGHRIVLGTSRFVLAGAVEFEFLILLRSPPCSDILRLICL